MDLNNLEFSWIYKMDFHLFIFLIVFRIPDFKNFPFFKCRKSQMSAHILKMLVF